MATIIDVRLSEAARAAERMAFSIGTLLRHRDQYEAMRATFLDRGFAGADCEFLVVDNRSDDQWDAFRGLNAVFEQARGRYVILCHEDVRLLEDGRAALEARLAELTAGDPAWAVAGNAGGKLDGTLAIRISDSNRGDGQYTGGPFPVEVMSLDENFMVVRRSARVTLSWDLGGFHFYGADLCLNAGILGRSAYVIDFHLRHLSGGTLDAAFWEARKAFAAKWNRALRRRAMRTTTTTIPLGPAD